MLGAYHWSLRGCLSRCQGDNACHSQDRRIAIFAGWNMALGERKDTRRLNEVVLDDSSYLFCWLYYTLSRIIEGAL